MEMRPRRYVRVLTSLDVYWGTDRGRPEARLTSLSIDGCLIETHRRVSVGRLVSFEAQLPTGARLTLEGRVIYQRPPVGFGVLFTPLSEAQRSALTRIIEAARASCSLPEA